MIEDTPARRPHLVRTALTIVLFAVCVTAGVSPDSVAADANEAPGAPRSARALSAGPNHACALLDDGTVRCWGVGSFGRLGHGAHTSIGDDPGEVAASPPVDLGTGRTATAVAVGETHGCALLDDAHVKCWGVGNLGQLGTGGTAHIGDEPGEMGDNLPPIDLGTGRTATAISAGSAHTCAILDNGDTKCWGSGDSGQLGTGTTETLGDGPGEMGDNLPPIDLGTGRTATAISAGSQHTCAILDNGDTKCWGAGTFGRLGHGGIHSLGDGPGEMGDNLPTVDLGTGRTATAISAGSRHTCAILDNGDTKCWGDGYDGQLGTGNIERIGDEGGEMGDDLSPIDLGTGRTVGAISAGGSHTCAVLDDGTAKCWGAAGHGQLGTEDNASVGDGPGEMGDDLPPIDLGTGRTAATVTTGHRYTCAVLDNARLVCFGDGDNGRLGTGSTDDVGNAPGQMGDAIVAVPVAGAVAAARVDVGLSTTQSAVVAGSTVHYTVRITNSGHRDLRGLALNAPGMSTCGAVPSSLGVGLSRTIVCTTTTTTSDTPVLRRTVSVVTADTDRDTAVGAVSGTVSTNVAPRQHRPDAQIRSGTKRFVGNDRYNVTAKKQTVTTKTAQTARFTIRVQNDGNVVDTFSVRGNTGTNGFAVAYSRKGSSITKKVLAGRYRISDLSPGASVDITVIVTSKKGAAVGDRIPVSVRTASVSDTTKRDVVRAVTVRR